MLNESGVAVSMDGRGRCMDNIFIERLWRSLKYEAVYLHELSDGFQAQKVISGWMAFYNSRRPHSALGAPPLLRPMTVDCRQRPESIPLPLSRCQGNIKMG